MLRNVPPSRRFLLSMSLLVAPLASAQTGDPAPASTPTPAVTLAPASAVMPWKKVSAADREKSCKTYEGTFISYYGELWKVENCKRRGIRSQSAILDIVSQVNSVTEVDGATIAVIPEGVPLADDDPASGPMRGCKEFEGKYITHSYLDIFFIEGCKKRLMPDWETYLDHKARRHDEKSEVFGLSYAEFLKIPTGKEIPSIADEEFRRLLKKEKTPDVVPAKDACKGLEGEFVSYYSKLYKIENCRRREIDSELFFEGRLGLTRQVLDLSDEQWISIPEGKPLKSLTESPAPAAPAKEERRPSPAPSPSPRP
jgi:hypothetical protein